jgi:hypothetical protein
LALKRAIAEVASGVLAGRSLTGIRKSNIKTTFGFFDVADTALEFTWIAAAMNTFIAGRPDVRNFRWLVKCDPTIRERAEQCQIPEAELEALDKMLRPLRNEEYFHQLDRGLGKFEATQENVGFESGRVHRGLVRAYKTMAPVYRAEFNVDDSWSLFMARYSPAQARDIARAADSAKLTRPGYHSREHQSFSRELSAMYPISERE